MINKTIKSFSYALNGLRITWKEERNFRMEIFVAILVLFCIFYFDFSVTEKIFVILAITLVLGAEIINTAVEDLCNKVESNTDPIIAKIKDTSSAFVFVIGLGSFVVGLLVFCSHFKIIY